MSLEEKKRVILEAAKTISKRQIDVSGKGKAVQKLEQGKEVTSEKLEQMYKVVTEITQSEKGLKQETKTKKQTLGNSFSLKQLEQRLAKLEDKLEQVVGSLILRVEALENRRKVMLVEPKEKPSKVLGFSICLKLVLANGKNYQKWHAVKYVAGRQVWIYLGNSPDNAEEKIKEYCQRKGISLATESNR